MLSQLITSFPLQNDVRFVLTSVWILGGYVLHKLFIFIYCIHDFRMKMKNHMIL